MRFISFKRPSSFRKAGFKSVGIIYLSFFTFSTTILYAFIVFEFFQFGFNVGKCGINRIFVLGHCLRISRRSASIPSLNSSTVFFPLLCPIVRVATLGEIPFKVPFCKRHKTF